MSSGIRGRPGHWFIKLLQNVLGEETPNWDHGPGSGFLPRGYARLALRFGALALRFRAANQQRGQQHGCLANNKGRQQNGCLAKQQRASTK